MTITGYITRLVAPEGAFPERIFFAPDPGQDLRALDGKHKAAYGAEIIAHGKIAGRKLGDVVRAQLTDDKLVAL